MYVKGTVERVLLYGGGGETEDIATGYVDLDYAASIDAGKSPTDYMFTSFDVAISWKPN